MLHMCCLATNMGATQARTARSMATARFGQKTGGWGHACSRLQLLVSVCFQFIILFATALVATLDINRCSIVHRTAAWCPFMY